MEGGVSCRVRQLCLELTHAVGGLFVGHFGVMPALWGSFVGQSSDDALRFSVEKRHACQGRGICRWGWGIFVAVWVP